MNDYKTRLLSEYKEVVDKINKLRVFLNNKMLIESRMLTDGISFKEVENV